MSMGVFLVGGAVRDQLLRDIGIERPEGDEDYVVVGATADELLSQGFQRVGVDFPVFLHPRTHDEYALARAADGSFQPDVTLRDDLLRRDLSINAIALDADGHYVDPAGGQGDISNKTLRHINQHFADDPLRILRVARFAAQLPTFTVADETLSFMTDLVGQGVLNDAVAERVFAEIRKAMGAAAPHRFVEVLRECGALKVILPEVDALYGVPQPAQYHPEIDTGEHVCLALQQSAKLAPGNAMVGFAVLLHDVGKGLTPKEQWPRHIGHEGAGVALIAQRCQRLRAPKQYRILAEVVSREHLRVHRAEELRPATLLNLIESLGGIRAPDRFQAALLACEADARGRTGFELRDYLSTSFLTQLRDVALEHQARDLIAEGSAPGPALADKLRIRRIDAMRAWIKSQT